MPSHTAMQVASLWFLTQKKLIKQHSPKSWMPELGLGQVTLRCKLQVCDFWLKKDSSIKQLHSPKSLDANAKSHCDASCRSVIFDSKKLIKQLHSPKSWMPMPSHIAMQVASLWFLPAEAVLPMLTTMARYLQLSSTSWALIWFLNSKRPICGNWWWWLAGELNLTLIVQISVSEVRDI